MLRNETRAVLGTAGTRHWSVVRKPSAHMQPGSPLFMHGGVCVDAPCVGAGLGTVVGLPHSSTDSL
eukprot:6389779-Alexandrium_andersonii.AAC.1